MVRSLWVPGRGRGGRLVAPPIITPVGPLHWVGGWVGGILHSPTNPRCIVTTALPTAAGSTRWGNTIPNDNTELVKIIMQYDEKCLTNRKIATRLNSRIQDLSCTASCPNHYVFTWFYVSTHFFPLGVQQCQQDQTKRAKRTKGAKGPSFTGRPKEFVSKARLSTIGVRANQVSARFSNLCDKYDKYALWIKYSDWLL